MTRRIAVARQGPGAALAVLACALSAPADPPALVSDLPRATAGGQRLVRGPESAATAAEEPDGTWRVRLELAAPAASDAVSARVAGSFTAWQSGAVAMRRASGGGFEATLSVPPGEHRYKFILDGSRWIADPDNAMRADDGNGGWNSVLLVGPRAALDPSRASAGDGRIEAAALLHRPASAADRWASDGGWTVRLRTLAGDVESAFAAPAGAPVHAARPMRRVGRDGALDVWEGFLPAAGGASIPYTFILKDGPVTQRDPRTYALDPSANGFRTPQWAKDAVWYQVMVDRFRNGDPSNDPAGTIPWTHDWYRPAAHEGADGQTFYKHFVFGRFAGGDLAGLRAKLPYLKSLGINALYLMPVFQATTPHKYNATSFIHVDEHFGTKGDYARAAAAEDILDPATWTFTPTDRAFLSFLREAKSMGFRVVIDGVFNHVGTAHPAFQDARRNGKASRFADWFDVTSWEPFAYESWWGFSELPVFRKDAAHGIASASARRHLMEITRRWMDPDGDGDPSDGVDGWRLDVPNEVPLPFWHEWCRFVRGINPDAYVVGEIWERADQWLDGRSFDAVMNYEFAKPAVAWVIDRARRIPPSELDRRLAELRLAYPPECSYAMMNLLDSHDTDRVASMALNPDRPYNQQNREQDGARYDASRPGDAERARQRLLVLLQMTYVGAPMVYYGDEVGMWGSSDPNNRKPMLWPDLGPFEDPQSVPDEGMLAFYRQAIALRRAHPALRTGDFRTVRADDAQDTWVFARSGGGEEVLVALNASDRPATVELPGLGGGWRDVFASPGADDGGPARATVPALGGRVWQRAAR